MEIVFIFFIPIFLIFFIGWVSEGDDVRGSIAFLLLLGSTVYLFIWLSSPRNVDVIIPFNVTTSNGTEMTLYFEDSETLKIVPNHIVEIHIIHPRWGSMNPKTYEYKFTHTIEN
jgi:hypothetical protein